MVESGKDNLRQHSRWLARLSLILLVATALVILVPTILALFRVSARGGDLTNLLGWSLVTWSPTIFYLYALWAIRNAFSHFAAGGTFGPAIARGCTRAGIALAAGGTLSAVGVPNIYRLLQLQGDPGGPIQRIGTILHFDTAYLAVGVVGLALILLGRLLARAAELQGEAARLRGELDEFF